MVDGGEWGLSFVSGLLGPRPLGRWGRPGLALAGVWSVLWLCIYWGESFRRINDDMGPYSSAIMALVALVVILVLLMCVVIALSVAVPSSFGPRTWSRAVAIYRVGAVMSLALALLTGPAHAVRLTAGLTNASLLDHALAWGLPMVFVIAIIAGTRLVWARLGDPRLTCDRCGYDLCGTDARTCPECGHAVHSGRGAIARRPAP